MPIDPRGARSDNPRVGTEVDRDSTVLVGELGRRLACGEATLEEALDGVLAATGSARVSVAALGEDDTFEILCARGEWLLAPGTRFPLETSTHFDVAHDGEAFVAASFASLEGFDRPVDRIVRTYGFASGACLPLRHEQGVPGALALHYHEAGEEAEAAAELLEPILGTLSYALAHPAKTSTLEVLVCHDDPLIGRGLAGLLEEAGSVRARFSSTRPSAIRSASEAPPDLVVADHAFEGARVDDWVGDLRRAGIGAPLVVVPTHDTRDNLAAAVAAGAVAYVPRREVEHRLVDAIAAVAAGRTWLPLVDDLGPPERLTRREREVLEALDRGLRLHQIASALGISHATVKAHVRNIFRKLGVSSRAEATHEARLQGLL
jgi:DNA-binding NarL/FixJ family response regulator